MNSNEYLQIQTTLYGYEEAFTLQCLNHSQWNLRAKSFCNVSERYYCLYDENKRRNVEGCQDEPQFDAPGKCFFCIYSIL